MKFYNVCLLVSILLFSTSFKDVHPIKLTASLIEYNPEKTSLRMECRVFIDDFENSINKTRTNPIRVTNLSKEGIKGIEEHFEKYYTIIVNDKKIPLKYKSSEIMEKYNILIIKFYEDTLALKKGDQICIENTLFFEEFKFLQTNRITVQLPPFLTQEYFEAKYDDYSIPINL